MNERQQIVDAYAQARARGERTALATVVSVEGSAYRRPGARMLLTENGHTVGTISGGCLERDVSLRVAQVLDTHDAQIIEYDTRGQEDIVWGLGLGCNGVVRVLLESLHEGSGGARALDFIADCLQARARGVVATVTRCEELNSSARVEEREFEVGGRILLDEQHNVCGSTLHKSAALSSLSTRIREDAFEILAGERASGRTYEAGGARVEIFFDVIMPPRALVVFGAEQDAVPLVRPARALGWHVTIVDTRARRQTLERFAEADEIVLCRAAEVAARVSLTERTAAVVMTHNYLDDVELLRALLPSPACYVGILGPKQRTSKLLEELGADSLTFSHEQPARLHSPIGMDIGAETPEEIALSIICEIKAFCAARAGGFLRDRNAPIHVEREAQLPPHKASIKPSMNARASNDGSASPFATHTS